MIGRYAKPGSYKDLMDVKDFLRVGFAGLLALVGYFLGKEEGIYRVAGLVCILLSAGINGIPIIIGAVKGLIDKKINVDELVSIAIIACLISGEYLTAAVVGFVMVLGSLIEEATAESARKAIHSLMAVNPENAVILRDGKEKTISVSEVVCDDVLLVKPGERIPVDAVIMAGTTAVDESSITGEPIPVEKAVDDPVFAGTLNQNGVIKIRTTRVGEDTTLGKVIRLVLEAEAHKPESITVIDRYAGWFTPFILACAAVTWGLTGEVDRAVAVLIVGCPCALILAAPTAIVAAISRAARAGILIKGGQYLERTASANTILFDKTGTLTEGRPKVNNIVPVRGIEKNYLLQQAACVEQNSTHPLARAILKAAHYARITINAAEDLFTEIGIGVKGLVDGSTVEVGSAAFAEGTMAITPPLRSCLKEIKEKGATPLVVFKDKKALGVISVADHVRPVARKTLSELKELGIEKVGILSGDHRKSVDIVGGMVGATDTWASLKPDDKLKILRNLQADGYRVMFVGDGINDAPALAAADVGVAMGAKGTEVALETADIALMHDDISTLPFLIKLSRRMVFIIKLNIAFGLVFNLLAVLAGGGGYISPIMGSIVHNVGSVLVVLSSASIGFTSKEGKGPGKK